jgi:hypothetical protein
MKAAVKGESSFTEGMKNQWTQLRRASAAMWDRDRGNGGTRLQTEPPTLLPDEPPVNVEAKRAAASKSATQTDS